MWSQTSVSARKDACLRESSASCGKDSLRMAYRCPHLLQTTVSIGLSPGTAPPTLSYAWLRWLLPTGFTTLARSAIIAPTVVSPAPATAPPAESAAGSLRSRFIDRKCPSARVFAVQRCHRFFCFIVVGHLDKTKTAGSACIAIGRDRRAVNGSKRLKQRP